LRRILDADAAAVLEAGCVVEEMPHQDWPRLRIRDPEVEVSIDLGVEVHPTLLHQLHQGSPSEQFRARARAEEGSLRIRGGPSREVCVAIPAGEQDLSTRDDRYDRAGNLATVELLRHHPVNEVRKALEARPLYPHRWFCLSGRWRH
jgi:hypothetical protein